MSNNMQLAHKLVAKTAKEMAAEFYDTAARNNKFYKQWPHERIFVVHNWRYFVKLARACLTHLLTKPEYTEEQKELIFEALIMDRSLPQGGASVAAVPSAVIH